MRIEWVTLNKTEPGTGTFQSNSVVSSVDCWAEKKSASRSEFYTADANGRKLDAIFVVSPIDFDGHQTLVHHDNGSDIIYEIVRDYKMDTISVELTCSRLTG